MFHACIVRFDAIENLKNFLNFGVKQGPRMMEYRKALFGCIQIRINPYVLEWVRVELELNSTQIHSNTCRLRSIRQHPNKTECPVHL